MHYVRLDDVDSRLNPTVASPYFDSFLNGTRAKSRFELIDKGLSLQDVRARAARESYPWTKSTST